jgi:nucleoid-associated protein EbfC
MSSQDELSRMMQQVQQLQSDMAAAQQSLVDERVEGTAGGGVVKAVCNGQGELLAVEIDPSVVDPSDVEMLQDLIVAAINDVHRKADEELSRSMGGMMGGMKIPGL